MIDLAGQGRRLIAGVGMGDADQDEQARARQAADRRPAYRYARLDGTLDDSSHEKAFFQPQASTECGDQERLPGLATRLPGSDTEIVLTTRHEHAPNGVVAGEPSAEDDRQPPPRSWWVFVKYRMKATTIMERAK